jgi:hypothetical protein
VGVSENRFSKDVLSRAIDSNLRNARVFPFRVTALMLCISARLQSGRTSPTKIRALAPGLFPPRASKQLCSLKWVSSQFGNAVITHPFYLMSPSTTAEQAEEKLAFLKGTAFT